MSTDRSLAKIDLDDLEHDAFACPVAACPSDHPMHMPPHGCAATRLALISRIRELEEALGDAVREWARTDQSDERGTSWARRQALLEKGMALL